MLKITLRTIIHAISITMVHLVAWKANLLLKDLKHVKKWERELLMSDGDTSFYKEIREMRLYVDPELIVEKHECVSHLFRNFRKAFKKLSAATQFKPASRKYITEAKGDDICKGIRMADAHWHDLKVGLVEKLTGLKKDCINAPFHYFGFHDECNEYFCKKITTDESKDIVKLLKSDGLFHEIMNLCQDYFCSNVKSLLANHTNNWAEEFNNLAAKYLGGKRINNVFNSNSLYCFQLENQRKNKLKCEIKSSHANEEYFRTVLKSLGMEKNAIQTRIYELLKNIIRNGKKYSENWLISFILVE